MKGFDVVFERWSDEDLEIGETDERGFIIENVDLREALENIDWYGRDCYSDYAYGNPTYIAFHKTNGGTREYYEEGITENRTLFIPDTVTKASKLRICRLLGVI